MVSATLHHSMQIPLVVSQLTMVAPDSRLRDIPFDASVAKHGKDRLASTEPQGEHERDGVVTVDDVLDSLSSIHGGVLPVVQVPQEPVAVAEAGSGEGSGGSGGNGSGSGSDGSGAGVGSEDDCGSLPHMLQPRDVVQLTFAMSLPKGKEPMLVRGVCHSEFFLALFCVAIAPPAWCCCHPWCSVQAAGGNRVVLFGLTEFREAAVALGRACWLPGDVAVIRRGESGGAYCDVTESYHVAAGTNQLFVWRSPCMVRSLCDVSPLLLLRTRPPRARWALQCCAWKTFPIDCA